MTSIAKGSQRNLKKGCPRMMFTNYYMGVSENSVALNPMVNDHYPY